MKKFNKIIDKQEKIIYYVCKATNIQKRRGSMNFGDYISQKRKEKNFTIRELANRLEISFTYLSDVEKGRSKAFKQEILKKIIEVLQLNKEESDILNDLAGESQGSVAPDIAEYLKNHPEAVVAFRKNVIRKEKNE